MYPRIVITMGEPAGIGPDIAIQIAQQQWDAELNIIGDPDLLLSRAKRIGLPLIVHDANFSTDSTLHQPGVLHCVPVSLSAPCESGKLNPQNADYVVTCLTTAADLCVEKKAQALVTGPIQKSLLNTAGIAFTGHTEFLAEYCHVTLPLMLFVTDQAKVALATTHLPLSDVPKALTQQHILQALRILHTECQKKFDILHPRILVCGVNPHAGEGGHLGREEIDIIEPALEQARQEQIDVTGPLPADTLFTEKYLKYADVILGMYHDQVLPVVKYMSFGHAVNVTLGLPIIRTSVDHGTALDIAGTGKADPGSLAAAIALAIKLIKI